MATTRNIRKNSDLKFIMLHHSEHFQSVSGKDINASLVQEGQFGIPFDIIINTSGKIDLSPRWIRAANPTQYVENAPLYSVFKYTLHDIADACANQQMNYQALHILLLGNFDVDLPSIAQINTLEKLVALVRDNVPSVTDLLFHNDIVTVSCPGLRFQDAVRKDRLRNILLPDTRDTHVFQIQGNIIPVLRLVNNVQPDVNLAWNDVAAQAHVTVSYYNVYRIDVTSNGSITLIGTSTGLTFDDLHATTNFTYTYYVTAVLDNGIESPLSNPVTTTVSGIIPLQWLFVGVGTVVALVDVSTPTAPVLIGTTYSLGGGAPDVQSQPIADSRYFAYVTNAATSRQVWIFDWATNPAAITRVGTYTDVNKWFVQKAMKSLGTNRLIVPSIIAATMVGTLDVSNPATPTLLSSTSGGAIISGVGGGAVISNTLWGGFSKSAANGLYSVPLTEPIGPATFRVNNSNLSGATVAVGDYVYQAVTPLASFNIYNTNPFSATPVGTYALSGTGQIGGAAPLLRGYYLFIPLNDAASRRAFQIVDVSNPIAPVHVASAPSVTSRDATGGTSIVIHGNYVYCVTRVTGNNLCRLLVFSIATITSPVLVADIDVSSGQNPVVGHCWAYPNQGTDGNNLLIA